MNYRLDPDDSEPLESQLNPPAPKYPNDYLKFSIVNLIFCNILLGIISMIFSLKTRENNVKLDIKKAIKYSKLALIFNVITLITGILTYIFFITIVFVRITTR
jgi:hypothetical protein